MLNTTYTLRELGDQVPSDEPTDVEIDIKRKQDGSLIVFPGPACGLTKGGSVSEVGPGRVTVNSPPRLPRRSSSVRRGRYWNPRPQGGGASRRQPCTGGWLGPAGSAPAASRRHRRRGTRSPSAGAPPPGAAAASPPSCAVTAADAGTGTGLRAVQRGRRGRDARGRRPFEQPGRDRPGRLAHGPILPGRDGVSGCTRTIPRWQRPAYPPVNAEPR